MIKHKFGLCGTSCCGKTTLSYAILSRLKKYSILADTVSNLDRTFCWDIKYIETELAQNWHITNLISKEIERSLREDVDVLVTDRTPLDLFAYYSYQHNTDLSKAMLNYIKEYIKTYDCIYYLPPLEYQYDNKRPSNDFRLGVDNELKRLIQLEPFSQKVVTIDREDILGDILSKLNFKKPSVKYDLFDDDLQALCDGLKVPLILKVKSNQDSLSDYDLFIEGDVSFDRETAYNYIRNAVGKYVDFDLMIVPPNYNLDFNYKKFYPKTI